MKAVSDYVNMRRPSALVAYKATADVVGKAVTLLVTVGAARALPTEAFGVLALGMTTGWMLGVASDAGLPLYLARAVARDSAAAKEGAASAARGATPSAFERRCIPASGVAPPSNIPDILGRRALPSGRLAALGATMASRHGLQGIVRDVMRLRAQLAMVAACAGAVVAGVWAPPGYVLAFALVVLAHLAGAVLDTLAHVYRGLGRTDVESTITIVTRLSTAVLVVIVLSIQPALLLLSVALLVPPATALVVSFAIASRLTGPGFTASEPSPGLGLLREAAPIGAGILLSAIYFRCDVYFVSYWHGLETVGMYNAVFRLVEGLRLLPAAALAVAFPALCRATDARPLRRLAATLTVGGLVTMAVTYAAASGIVDVIYGAAYLAAAPALRVLALALPLFFLNYALTHQVIAWDGQRAYAAITAAALVANVTGNLVLIPSQGMVGAAWSTLVTELVVTSGCLVALAKGPAPVHREVGEIKVHREIGEIGEINVHREIKEIREDFLGDPSAPVEEKAR